VVAGGRDVTVPAPLEELPLLVRAGAVLPLLPADVDTLAPYGPGAGAVALAERRSRIELVAFPRGRSEARPYGTERVVSSERRGRRWVLRIEGTRRRAYRVQAALASLRRPFRPCSVRRGGGRRVRFTSRGGVVRFAVRGRDLRVEVRGCRRR
jgi:hypothetical protein